MTSDAYLPVVSQALLERMLLSTPFEISGCVSVSLLENETTRAAVFDFYPGSPLRMILYRVSDNKQRRCRCHH